MATILVVDDSSFSRGRVEAALAPLGCEVVQAVDGQNGLNVCQARSPDLIFTDLLMPNLDGFGMLRELRARGIETPVIVISADIQESSRQLCRELGASSFLNKPFQAKDLQAKVQELLPQLAVAS